MDNKDHISVCICTYKRPDLLARLLRELQNQETDNLFSYSIVVVDNDYKRSAKNTVESFQQKTLITIEYYCEPEQNIALARNRAVKNAKGNFIAFIDDDEFPANNWLLNLYKAYNKFKADGVLGPVKPHFDGNPPDWLIRGKFCERKSHNTGTVLHWDDTRTGNVLLNKTIFDDTDCKFDRRFGRSGGEDIDFFKKSIKSGWTFIWCNEAPVYETVPPERWNELFYLRKNLRIGGLNGERKRKENGKLRIFIKRMVATMVYSFVLPASILIGRHIFFKYLLKVTYNFGWFVGFCENPIIRYRTD